MADTGKLAVGGFGAGAIKYVTLHGFVPNNATNANLVTMGFGQANAHKLILHGFDAHPGGGGGFPGPGAYYIFGGAVVA